MKKVLAIIMFLSFLSVNAATVSSFDALEGITPAQKNKLSQIQNQFKIQNDLLDQKIIGFNTKVNELNNDTTKSPAEVAMLKAAYERNISTLKSQQEKLTQETDNLYKAVMTPEQFNSFKKQNEKVDDAFKNFLNK